MAEPSSASIFKRPLDEAAEEIWGYLLPIDAKDGTPLVLRNRRPEPKRSEPSPPLKPAPADFKWYFRENPVFGIGKTITSKGYLIGRDPECDFHIKGPYVSNRHCSIFPDIKDGRARAVVHDLSINGTFVNDAIVGRNRERALEDGDEIAIFYVAKFIFRYPLTTKIESFSQQYIIEGMIGKGHHAYVYSCVEKSTGQHYAVKIFTQASETEQETSSENIRQEIAVLMGVRHLNILCLKDVFYERNKISLVIELAAEGELFHEIVRRDKLSEAETRKVFLQLFQGIKYLHDRDITHRDIKPENILLTDKELSVKLADFGLSKIVGEDSFTTSLCGTPSYVAPEVLEPTNKRRYTHTVDIWSLGVVLYICLCGFPPFSDELYSEDNPYGLSEQIKTGRFGYPSPYWDSVGDPALDLIDHMLTVDVTKRYTIDGCLNHPWTRNVEPDSTDDTTEIASGLTSLDLSHRRITRERTLLSQSNYSITSKVSLQPGKVSSLEPFLAQAQRHEPISVSKTGLSKLPNLMDKKRPLPVAYDQLMPPTKLSREPANLGEQGTYDVIGKTSGSPLNSSSSKSSTASDAIWTPEPETILHSTTLEPTWHPVDHSANPEPLISMSKFPVKSPANSSDEASASTEATDPMSSDHNIAYSDDDDDVPVEDYELSDRKPEMRIMDPGKYFQNLRNLETEVIRSSCLSSVHAVQSSIRRNVLAGDLAMPLAAPQSVYEGKDLIFECERTITSCCSNIERLQAAGFCGEYVTVVTQDDTRLDVAKLQKIPTKNIFDLQTRVRETRDHLETFDLWDLRKYPELGHYVRSKMRKSCNDILVMMGMTQESQLSLPFEGIEPLAILYTTVQALDILVASYSGTHISRFDKVYTNEGQMSYEFPIAKTHYTNTYGSILTLTRRRLKCMDHFLGGCEVWVLHREYDWSTNERMWLSTGIEELNDLWGPCWKFYRNDEPGKIQSIEIGNGCILPWVSSQVEEDTRTTPQPTIHERYAHWMPSKDWDDTAVEIGQMGLEQKFFGENDIFLIGTSPYHGLAINPSCKPSKADLVWKKTRLAEKNALRTPKTSYARRFKDSHTYQVSASIPIAGSHSQALSYKRQEGLDRKSALVERWRNNSGYPGELEDFSGIEVSICTQNACRIRLLHVLGSDTMRSYLRGISFAWPPERFEINYFEAMKSRRRFRRFWNSNLRFSDKISRAISLCLDMLQTTGVNSNNGELGALWVAEFEDEDCYDFSDYESDDDTDQTVSNSSNEETDATNGVEVRTPFKKVEELIVTLFRSEYTWTGFLRDSPETLTMAIITSNCLEATDEQELGRRCNRGWWEDGTYIKVHGYPVIRTSLFVNEAILKSSQLISEEIPGRGRKFPAYRIWNTRGLEERARFSLGDHGTLEVCMLPTDECPITIMDWTDVKSSRWNELNATIDEDLVGRSSDPHHKEHISGVWETRPLPVLIMSKSKKGL